jgi:hypothetical protein
MVESGLIGVVELTWVVEGLTVVGRAVLVVVTEEIMVDGAIGAIERMEMAGLTGFEGTVVVGSVAVTEGMVVLGNTGMTELGLKGAAELTGVMEGMVVVGMAGLMRVSGLTVVEGTMVVDCEGIGVVVAT